MEERKAAEVVFATSQHKDLLLRGIPREMQTLGTGDISEADRTAVRRQSHMVLRATFNPTRSTIDIHIDARGLSLCSPFLMLHPY